MSDEQVFGFIDMLARQDLWVLQWLAYAIWCLGSLVRPAAAAYKVVDDYTFGSARYFVMILVMVVLYYVSFVSFIVLKVLWKYVYALAMVAYRMMYPAISNAGGTGGGVGTGGGLGEGSGGAGSNSNNEFEF
ncbi:hypothetical protein EON65_22530 [archaeon]|nr:MAG: hypothetical protein EON65_22530 [archaeon]